MRGANAGANFRFADLRAHAAESHDGCFFDTCERCRRLFEDLETSIQVGDHLREMEEAQKAPPQRVLM